VEHRYSVLNHLLGPVGSGAFYQPGSFPGTAQRMEAYRQSAPALAEVACRRLGLDDTELAGISHLIVTSCTGFYAPGLDIDLITRLPLRSDVARTMIGFMGCHAGITGLRTAADIVRGDASARVLVVNLELCSLHLQENAPFDRLVAALLFSDGCAASFVSATPSGLRLDGFASVLAPDSANRMSWNVGDSGFEMTLDAKIPEIIRTHLQATERKQADVLTTPVDFYAVHPGGRAILDAVESGLQLAPEKLEFSREVLRNYGNMSSAAVMFVLARFLDRARNSGVPATGMALAFGPGLAVESAAFTCVPEAVERRRNSVELAGFSASIPRSQRCV
jgi:predicted naringenin-chalcone synthase